MLHAIGMPGGCSSRSCPLWWLVPASRLFAHFTCPHLTPAKKHPAVLCLPTLASQAGLFDKHHTRSSLFFRISHVEKKISQKRAGKESRASKGGQISFSWEVICLFRPLQCPPVGKAQNHGSLHNDCTAGAIIPPTPDQWTPGPSVLT